MSFHQSGTPVPYYDDDLVTIYNEDCARVLPAIGSDDVALVLTDPPYGIALDTAYGARRPGAVGGRVARGSRDHARVHGDDQPYDPAPLLRFPRLVLFGANHFADKLPASGAWLVWDKFCCAGGAAMGYHRAGFEVVGVDIAPQPPEPEPEPKADVVPIRGRS